MKRVYWLVLTKQHCLLADAVSEINACEKHQVINCSSRIDGVSISCEYRDMSTARCIMLCVGILLNKDIVFRVPHLSFHLAGKRPWRMLVILLRLRPELVDYYDDGMNLALRVSVIDKYILVTNQIFCFSYQYILGNQVKKSRWKQICQIPSIPSDKSLISKTENVVPDSLVIICSKYLCSSIAARLITEYAAKSHIRFIIVVLHPNQSKNIQLDEFPGIKVDVVYIRLTYISLEEWIAKNHLRVSAYIAGMTSTLLFLYEKLISNRINGCVHICPQKDVVLGSELEAFMELALRMQYCGCISVER